MISQNIKEKFEKRLVKLANQVILEISRNEGPTIQFCGPISTGGLGTVDENLLFLSSAINYAKSKNFYVFDQASYERDLDRIMGKQGDYDYPILDYFYKPILSSGKIKALIFLPMWETSTGSNWEHDFAKSLGIPVYYVERNLSNEIDEIYKQLQ